MIDYNQIRARKYLREHEPKLTQDQISADGSFVAGKDVQLSNEATGFLRSLPNTQRGLAVSSSQLKRRKCRKALFDEVQKQKGERGKHNTPDVTVNLDWYERLPVGHAGECYIEFTDEWLSEQRTKEATGLSFDEMVTYGVAAPALIYVVSEADLSASDRAIHFAKEGSLYLDRSVPRGRTEASAEWKYWPAEGEDGKVERWEVDSRYTKPSDKPTRPKRKGEQESEINTIKL